MNKEDAYDLLYGISEMESQVESFMTDGDWAGALEELGNLIDSANRVKEYIEVMVNEGDG
ncbi:hypothetical protein [Actinomadura oligospora]|uniref:hypothetical protein n=1 Tax=Actinomadura oligospora TaxID=111804 RepID=UPI0004795FD9|nr:hypothetical protein [Actinomadura oligospora]